MSDAAVLADRDESAESAEAAASSAPVSLADEKRDVARRRVLRAARVVLADRGLATTVDEVAAAADVSRRTIFRHFETRERLLAEAIKDGLRSYSQQLPIAGLAARAERAEIDAWLHNLLLVVHRLNANNGRIYWELAAFGAHLEGELASVAAERRDSRQRFATVVTTRAWNSSGRRGQPPTWLIDAFAVHLSAFTTQALGGDFGRTPEDVARVSANVLRAALDAALADR